jgi:hypothetical protein
MSTSSVHLLQAAHVFRILTAALAAGDDVQNNNINGSAVSRSIQLILTKEIGLNN